MRNLVVWILWKGYLKIVKSERLKIAEVGHFLNLQICQISNIYILARFLTKKFKRMEIEMQESRVSEIGRYIIGKFRDWEDTEWYGNCIIKEIRVFEGLEEIRYKWILTDAERLLVGLWYRTFFRYTVYMTPSPLSSPHKRHVGCKVEANGESYDKKKADIRRGYR